VKDLHDAVGGTADVVIRKGDARFDDLVPKDKIGTVSGILTSPPYPGVYDYVSFARKQRSRFRVGSTAGNGSAITTTIEETESEKPPTSYYVDAKVPDSNELDENGNRAPWSDDFSSANEFGAKRELRKDPSAFNDKWTRSQTQWLKNAYKTLKPSGRMLVMIGDGANVDALKSTVVCAEQLGFTLLASCSLALLRTMESTGTVYNGARKEHLILFEKKLLSKSE
jgi:DNA modification methylase